ncbi:MAG: hypothetical protein EBU84_21865, partial [Actinobacteria bacterium]|nr:hypothetical protein [Actinomycetota bacterium]
VQNVDSASGGIRVTNSNAGTSAGAVLRFGTDQGNIGFVRANSSVNTGAIGGASAVVIGNGLAFPVVVSTNGVARATFDSSGNLGLGVTPSAWGSTFKVMQFTGGASIGGTTDPSLQVTQNAYYNGTNWIYSTTAAASNYYQSGGAHVWRNAPSGTAGNAISFTQAMTLDASGNLLVGTTTANSAKFAVNAVPNSVIGSQAAFIAGSKSAYAGIAQLPQGQLFVYDNSGSSAGTGGAISFGGDAGGGQQTWYAAIEARKDNSTAGDYGAAMVFYTRPSGATAGERARITSGGYFKASNDGTYNSSTGSYHEFTQTANTAGFILRSTHATYADVVSLVYAARNTTNNSFYALGYYNTGAGV